jgi:hypothetical protein
MRKRSEIEGGGGGRGRRERQSRMKVRTTIVTIRFLAPTLRRRRFAGNSNMISALSATQWQHGAHKQEDQYLVCKVVPGRTKKDKKNIHGMKNIKVMSEYRSPTVSWSSFAIPRTLAVDKLVCRFKRGQFR